MASVRLPHVRVLLTRPEPQLQSWANLLTAAGAEPVLFPTIEVAPPPSWEDLDRSLALLDSYDWLIFSSTAAVNYTLGRCSDRASLTRLKVAAVGTSTAKALADAGVRVDVVPQDENQNGNGLAQALSHLPAGTRLLFPQTVGGRPELQEALTRIGCIVDVVAAAQTRAVSPLPPLPQFDVATFASPSALQALIDGAGIDCLTAKPVVVLGETTGALARKLGLVPHVAAAPDAGALLVAIASAVSA